MLAIGEIWRDSVYPVSGGTKPKFLLVAAVDRYDLLYCTATSRAHGRPENPACFHGDPYAGFFLGNPPFVPFTKLTWLDLQYGVTDADVTRFRAAVASGQTTLVGKTAPPLLCDALRCMRLCATKGQAKRLDAALVSLGVP
jgi:hypothetical protein